MTAAIGPAWGVQILDNGVVGTASSIVSEASPGADQVVADDFVMPLGFDSITGIQWRGTYARRITAAADNFTIEIFKDVASAIDSSPLYSLTPSVTRGGPDLDYVFTYEALFPALQLQAGETYWLSIFEDLATDLRWAWIQDRDGNLRYRNSVAQNFTFQIPNKVDFKLLADARATPEPSSFALALCGVAIAAASRRRRVTKGN